MEKQVDGHDVDSDGFFPGKVCPWGGGVVVNVNIRDLSAFDVASREDGVWRNHTTKRFFFLLHSNFCTENNWTNSVRAYL